MKYILNSNKAYGVRISIKNNNEISKFLEILFHSVRKDIFSYLEQIYLLSNNNNFSYHFHFYVRAETYDDENKLKERHYLWHEKTEEEFIRYVLNNSSRYIGFIDEK